MRKLDRQELVDILQGCAILGTGGGGSLIKGIQKIDFALSQGKEFLLVDFDELADEDLVATPYSCGAISPLSDEEKKKYEGLTLLDEEPHVVALREMEKYLNKDIKAVISTELGGGNTATALYCGAMAGKFIIDADPAGRSVPELQHSTYFLNDISIEPMSLVNKFGESAIISKVTDDYRAEALVRAMAVASQNNIAVVDHVETVKVLRNTVIRGAISDALTIGKAFRTAREKGQDISSRVADAGRGVVVFKGVVTSNEWGTVDGFTVGELMVKGEEDYRGNTLKVWYKNENIITWKNGAYFATVPDLVCIFDEDNKEPLLNPYGDKGKNISVIVLPSPKEWTTNRGLEVFGPRSFGYDIDWKPFV